MQQQQEIALAILPQRHRCAQKQGEDHTGDQSRDESDFDKKLENGSCALLDARVLGRAVVAVQKELDEEEVTKTGRRGGKEGNR